ncbi:unnamed protein product [Linum tenue]|uniref:Uncharacterized protein n=1 Tax=Linum tenue TaxID=586396 RepID=A0AAV0R2N2_9ROSI|nr:unnamed protein product [Linum tenue]
MASFIIHKPKQSSPFTRAALKTVQLASSFIPTAGRWRPASGSRSPAVTPAGATSAWYRMRIPDRSTCEPCVRRRRWRRMAVGIQLMSRRAVRLWSRSRRR